MSIEKAYAAQSSVIALRRTTESDLDMVLQLEQTPENRSFILPWTRKQHLDACDHPDIAHFLVETRHSYRPLGFLLLAGRESVHQSIELRRIVMAEKGKGYGKQTLALVKQVVFEQWRAHRLWLDVFDYNQRARYLYLSQGFVEEGILRESLFLQDRFVSLVLLSLLAQDYFSQMKREQVR